MVQISNSSARVPTEILILVGQCGTCVPPPERSQSFVEFAIDAIADRNVQTAGLMALANGWTMWNLCSSSREIPLLHCFCWQWCKIEKWTNCLIVGWSVRVDHVELVFLLEGDTCNWLPMLLMRCRIRGCGEWAEYWELWSSYQDIPVLCYLGCQCCWRDKLTASKIVGFSEREDHVYLVFPLLRDPRTMSPLLWMLLKW